MDEALLKAVNLVRWLIEKKSLNRKTAYIIASRKFSIPRYDLVRKGYNAQKPKQQALL